MSNNRHNLKADIEAINKINIIPSILNVVCRSTGMGFAAITRVTKDHWITCTTRDRLGIGLQAGDELKAAPFPCGNVQESSKPIVVEDVEKDSVYCDHSSAAIHPFRSYISVPIYRRDGSFFGTICSIDPKPADINSPEILEMFHIFAELISFHLNAMEREQRTTRKHEKELKTRELREQFIGILGHDLRNPLGTTRMGADVILKKSNQEDVKNLAQLIKATTYRMENLIGNLLDFARGRLGDVIYLDKKPSGPELEKVIQKVIKENKISSPKIGINTTIQLETPVPCDIHRIGQLLSNLLTNAIQHGDQTSPVSVSVSSNKKEFDLTVTNKGTKIPDAAMERLFKPFSRQEQKPEKSGPGLGLYIASEIANAHGGTLTAKSSNEETSFSFKLPINPPTRNENKI